MKKILAAVLIVLAASAVMADSYYQNFNDASDPNRDTWKIYTSTGIVDPTITHGLIVDQSNVMGVVGDLPGVTITTDSALAVEWAPYLGGTDLYLTNDNLPHYLSLANSGIGVVLSSTNHPGYRAVLTSYGAAPSDDNDALIMGYLFDPDHVTYYKGNTAVTDAAEIASLGDSVFDNTIGIAFGKSDFSQLGIFIDAVGVVENVNEVMEVPEPGSAACALLGLGSFLGMRRRVKK